MSLLTLRLLNLGGNVGVSLLHPPEQLESEADNDCLNAESDE